MSVIKHRIEQTRPYPILFDKRPIKHVYLINQTKLTKKIYSRIYGSNFDTYNGRFNPIVFTDGKTISDEALEFLKDFDADVIHFFVKPTKTLLRKINNNVSPYTMERHDPERFFGSRDQNINIGTITDDLISKLEKFHIGTIPPLVFFDVKELKSTSLKQFLHFNFGVYESYGTEQFNKVSSQKWIKVENTKDVNEAIKDLTQTYSKNFYPKQLCSIPNKSRDVKYSQESEHFTVVIGDSPSDLAHFWNHALMTSHWMRNNINELWLPTAIAKSKNMNEGLNSLLRYFGSRTGNNNNHCIRFVSFSLPEKELQTIADSLTQKAWCRKTVHSLEGVQVFPDYGKNKEYFSVPNGLEQYQAYTNEENIVVNEPHLPEGVYGGHWMLDVYIQYRPEKYQYTNVRHWWRLPRRRGSSTTSVIFPNKVARVKRNGIPSILMNFRHELTRDDNDLLIKIPKTDLDIFRAYIYGDSRPYYRSDLLGQLASENKHFYIQQSDKGRYLKGFLELFGGLYNAFSQFDEPYWRKMFDTLSNDKLSSNPQKKKEITSRLNKELVPFPRKKKDKEEKIDWLSEYILKLNKELGTEDKPMPFSSFLSHRINEEEERTIDGKKVKLSKKQKQHIEERLLDDINDLTELGVLLQGIKPHCDHCGYANWLPVDSLNKVVECRGCGNEFYLPPEKSWLYKLNSLVKDGIKQHGLIPVLLTFGQFYDSSRTSFLYTPSVDLFEVGRRNKLKHRGDLDIVFIQDGKFVMGEIKQSTGLFKEKHFTEMAKLAKDIRPDFLIFSAMNTDKPRKAFIEKHINQLNKELKDYGVSVIWYSPQRFSRVRL